MARRTPTTFYDIASNHEITTFVEIFSRRPLLQDRGINLDKLDEDSLIRIRRDCWDKFVQWPRDRVNETIIREFYTMLKRRPEGEQISEINVRGISVPWTPQAINDAFDLPTRFRSPYVHYEEAWGARSGGNLNHVLEVINQEWFPDLISSGQAPTADELPCELRTWKRFINNRVLYSEDFNELNNEELLLLFAIDQGVPINWGRLIHRSAITLAQNVIPPTALPFSWLINYLCVEVAGVHRLFNDEFFPSRTINHRLTPCSVLNATSSDEE